MDYQCFYDSKAAEEMAEAYQQTSVSKGLMDLLIFILIFSAN